MRILLKLAVKIKEKGESKYLSSQVVLLSTNRKTNGPCRTVKAFGVRGSDLGKYFSNHDAEI